MLLDGDGMKRRLDHSLPLQDVAEEAAATPYELGGLLLTPKPRYAACEPFPGLDGGHSAMSSTPGSPRSTKTAAGVDRPESDNSESMGEGEKLRRLLEIKRYEQLDLAKATGVTKTAVGKWIKESVFSNRVWPKIRDGLLKIGLNPADIRAGAQDQEASEDLTKLVERWPREQLTVLRRIVVSDDVSKSRLLAYLDGALRPFP